MKRLQVLLLLMAVSLPKAWSGEQGAGTPAQSSLLQAPSSRLPWLSSLAEGRRHAIADRKPMLVRVGASWCVPCRKLEAEIEKPSVQAELTRWTLVFLDADKSEDEASELNVTGVPALRVRTMLGETVASRDGFVSAEDLVAWLKKQYDAAAAEADEVLLTNDEPDAASVVRLVRQFQQRDPAIRETAIRRLAAWPQKTRFEVVRAFVEGGPFSPLKGQLSYRLAALEVLRQWRAPVDDLDPWQPESFSKQRIAALQLWAEKFQPPAAAPVKQLTEQALAEARRDIDRMSTASEADAAAIRDRLAGYGAALLPEVAARLKETAADEQRQRLWALRYRLAAADSLPLRWPGGLERLAAADPRNRRLAADELAKLATAADQPLLVELFSDSDPVVREFSLRGLQNIGGREATAALLKLLSDPEPNVRAAVLKQLEEKPDASIVTKLAEYLKTEKDPDLLVHAIRFLRAAGGATAARTLIPMLRHESWQVRAEACEALGKTSVNGSVSYVNGVRVDEGEVLQVEIYVALLELLNDSDAFVVSRAVEGLHSVDMAVAVEPLAHAAAAHPDLAPTIVAMLAHGQKMRSAAVPHLRKFRTHSNPLVRAAAMQGLCNALPGEMGNELAAGLNDPSDKVRIAAADFFFAHMEAQRINLGREPQIPSGSDDPFGASLAVPVPSTATMVLGNVATAAGDVFSVGAGSTEQGAGSLTPGSVLPAPGSQPQDPHDVWLKEFYAGKQRPKWADGLRPPLEKMFEAKNADEQFAAGMALVPLGRWQAVQPKLYQLIQADGKKYDQLTKVLPWLVWNERLAAFRKMHDIIPSPDNFYYLTQSVSQVHDRRACDLLWEILADPRATADHAGEVARGILEIYGINYWYSRSDDSPATKKALKDLALAIRPRAASGSDLQRLVALGLFTYADPEEAVRLAEKFQADSTAGRELRADAFQAALVLAPAKEGARTAAAALASPDRDRQKVALGYLVRGPESLRELRNRINLRVESVGTSRQSGQAIVPEPPAGLQISQILPLVQDSDPATAAEAGYLLALLGDARGLPPLLRYYHGEGKDDSQTQRLVYRAIAVLDDSSQIPVLKKIYVSLQRYEVSEFYWTIRIMTGPDILRFRKQIRDEVGMGDLQ